MELLTGVQWLVESQESDTDETKFLDGARNGRPTFVIDEYHQNRTNESIKNNGRMNLRVTSRKL